MTKEMEKARSLVVSNFYVTTIFNIIFGIVLIFLVIIIFLFIINKQIDANTSIQCCNGYACSDTYYTPKDNQCHLTLCENSPFTDKEECTYDGANKTIYYLEKE